MRVERLWLKDFRSYEALEIELVDGLCAVTGANGVGKSNLLEAIAYLSLLESFRGAPSEALIRAGAASAVVRGQIVAEGREQLIEAEIVSTGRNRVLLNRQRLTRNRDLLGALRVTVFSPEDLSLIKGGPALRRSYLDQLLVSLDPRNDNVRSQYDKALRQRNALLKQTHGRLDEAAEFTLAVWDDKLVESGEQLATLRDDVVSQLQPIVVQAYEDVAGEHHDISLAYVAPWRESGQGESGQGGSGLRAALRASRRDELRRGLTLVGPHRDDLGITLQGLPSRTHASQGEQRSLALALRLASHRLLHDVTGAPPVLLLDDVFSELDPDRSAALLRSLPAGQALLSTASGLPAGVEVAQLVTVRPGATGTVATSDVGGRA